MNCDLTCFLLDDYLENRLSRYDRQQMEQHLATCAHCARELRLRPAFENTMWRGLAAAVHDRRLSPEASQRIIRAAQAARRQAAWSQRAIQAGQAVLGLAALALVLFGFLFLIDQLRSSPQQGVQPSALREHAADSVSIVRIPDNALHFEPWPLRAGQPFTITLFLTSDQAEPGHAVGVDLDVSGPTGHYAFALPVRGPFAAGSVSALEVTPDTLAALCRAQYAIAPTQIFRLPGTYRVRAVLHGPSAAQDR